LLASSNVKYWIDSSTIYAVSTSSDMVIAQPTLN